MLSYNLVSLTSLTQEGHPSAVEESGVTLNLKGAGTVQFPLIGKLCRQYGYRPEATGRMVDTAQAKGPRKPIARSRTPEQVPPASPAPQQHLPPIAEEGNSTAEEGASGEGASSQDGGRVTDLDSESNLDMTGVGPILPATRKAPAAEAGAGTGGVAEGNPPALSAPSSHT